LIGIYIIVQYLYKLNINKPYGMFVKVSFKSLVSVELPYRVIVNLPACIVHTVNDPK